MRVKCDNKKCVVNKNGICTENIKNCVIQQIATKEEEEKTKTLFNKKNENKLIPPPLPPEKEAVLNKRQKQAIVFEFELIYKYIFVVLVIVCFLLGVWFGWVLKTIS